MKRIVILGAGFGGLKTALTLARKLKNAKLDRACEVVLVNETDHHAYTPLFY